MSKGHCVIAAVILCMITVHSLSSEKCQQSGVDTSCVVPRPAPGYPARPRFVYDWASKTCEFVRYAWRCADADIPAETNNFASEDECKNECSGWA